jgi:L-fuculose-phosphate aldolase
MTLSATEQEYREQICAVGKLLYDKGLIAGTEGNLSCRLPGEGILITPAAKCKGMLKPEDIVLLSPDGEPTRSDQQPSSEFRIHLCGYDHRPEFRAAVHAHPAHVTAFAFAGKRLEGDGGVDLDRAFGQIPLVEWAVPGTQELADQFEYYVHMNHTYLLESHGIIAFGADLMEAFFRVEMAERIAKTAYLTRMLIDVSWLEGDPDDYLDDDLFEMPGPPPQLRTGPQELKPPVKSSKKRKK